jgi:hypothetical protein
MFSGSRLPVQSATTPRRTDKSQKPSHLRLPLLRIGVHDVRIAANRINNNSPFGSRCPHTMGYCLVDLIRHFLHAYGRETELGVLEAMNLDTIKHFLDCGSDERESKNSYLHLGLSPSIFLIYEVRGN